MKNVKTLCLDSLNLQEDADITTILKDFADTVSNDDCLVIDFGTTVTRLRSDLVTFVASGFELKGSCEVMQADSAVQPTMFLVSNPDNVLIGESLTFTGSDSTTVVYDNSNEALIKIDASARTRLGGSVVCLANFKNTASIGLGIFNERVQEQYNKVKIAGDYNKSGLSSNCVTRRLEIDVTAQDPLAGNKGRKKTRGVSFGRVTETYSIDVMLKYGWSGVFGFAFPGATGNLNIRSYRFGYDANGVAFPHNGSSTQIFKTDTQKNGAVIDANIVMIGDAGRPARFSLEASPGPTNNSAIKAVGEYIRAELAVLENDNGLDNYECYGNKMLPGSDCASVRAGFASSISKSAMKQFVTSAYNLRSPALISQGTMLDDVLVKQEVAIHSGSSTYFRNCSLPANWNFFESIQETPTIISLRDCDLKSAKIEPTSFSNFLFGIEGTVTGLDTSNIPAETIPYWYVDGVSHPKFEGKAVKFPEDNITKIANPAGSIEPLLEVYSVASPTPKRAAYGKLVDIDAERVTGSVVFHNSNTTASLGALAVDLGVSEGRAEVDLEFVQGGAPEAGVSGRFDSEFGMIWARLNVDTQQLLLTIRYHANPPIATKTLPLSYDTRYKLALEIDDKEVRVYVDGALEITEPTTYQSDKTKWGWKTKLGENNDASVGPLIHSWKVCPIKDSSSTNFPAIELERRTL